MSDARSARWPALPIEESLPHCAVCVGEHGHGRSLRRFLLRIGDRGAGAILLCERCWRAATRDAQPHGQRPAVAA